MLLFRAVQALESHFMCAGVLFKDAIKLLSKVWKELAVEEREKWRPSKATQPSPAAATSDAGKTEQSWSALVKNLESQTQQVCMCTSLFV